VLKKLLIKFTSEIIFWQKKQEAETAKLACNECSEGLYVISSLFCYKNSSKTFDAGSLQ
jgi:hypothetical protein